jgi:hypothetical protein
MNGAMPALIGTTAKARQDASALWLQVRPILTSANQGLLV